MVQQEYAIGWTLVILFLFLGLLVVCAPRPRAVDLTPVDKRAIQAAKRKKMSEKLKKKRLKKKKK